MQKRILTQVHKTKGIREEMEALGSELMAIINKYQSLKSRAMFYSANERSVFPLAQLKDTDIQTQKRVVAQISSTKSALFYIIVGLTRKPNPIDPNSEDFVLNIVGHKGDTVSYIKHTLLLNENGTGCIIKTERDFGSLYDNPVEEVEQGEMPLPNVVPEIIHQEDETGLLSESPRSGIII